MTFLCRSFATFSVEDRNGVQRLSPLFHSQAPIVQKGGLIKAILHIILLFRIIIWTHLEVFYQFMEFDFIVGVLLKAYFPPESEGLGVEDLVSAPFSFSV